MTDIEKRLKALEKRARADTERWNALFGDTKALSLIADAIGAAICANNKPLLRTVIKNLQSFENAARIQNEHGLTIDRLRHARQFYEARLKKADEGGSTSSTNSAPPRKR